MMTSWPGNTGVHVRVPAPVVGSVASTVDAPTAKNAISVDSLTTLIEFPSDAGSATAVSAASVAATVLQGELAANRVCIIYPLLS